MLNRKIYLYCSLVLLVTFFAVLANHARALFVVEKSIKNNIIRTGYLDIEVTPSENMLTAESLMPGQNTGGTFKVTNTGGAAANLFLSVKKSVGYTALYESLQAVVTSNDSVLYTGALSGVQNISLTKSPLNMNEENNYQIVVSLPVNADSKLDNIYANLTFTIVGEQTNG